MTRIGGGRLVNVGLLFRLTPSHRYLFLHISQAGVIIVVRLLDKDHASV